MVKMNSYFKMSRVGGLVLILALFAMVTVPVHAADVITVEVDTVLDSDDAAYRACTAAADDCSLRGAISRANADTAHDYVITLPAGTYQLGIAPDATPDDNADGDLDVLGRVTIQGAGAALTFIQAGADQSSGLDRLVDVVGGGADLTLRDLTLRYGRASGGSGGAIRNAGTLSMETVTVAENTAVGQDAVEGKGGGVYNLGDLTLVGCTIAGNATSDQGMGVQQDGHLCGGGIYHESGTLIVTNSYVSQNTTLYVGGGLYSAGGSVVLSSTRVLTNAAEGSAGIYVAGGVVDVLSSTVAYNVGSAFGCGGVKNLGDLTLTGSSVSHNTAQSHGGGICNQGVLTVTDSILFDNVNRYSGGGIYNTGGTVILSASSVISNAATDSGGGIHSTNGEVAISASAIISNIAVSGGGIAAQGGTLYVRNSTLSDNRAIGGGGRGGAIIIAYSTLNIANSTLSGNAAVLEGGGIYAQNGALYILDSTLSDNRTTEVGSRGGGINILNNTLDIANSTLSGNAAVGDGGGIFATASIGAPSTVKVVNCTFVGNAGANGGAYAAFGIPTFMPVSGDISNSILTGSTGGDCYNNGGTLVGANNLIDDHAGGACSGISEAAVEGLELTLEDNGPSGATPILKTHMLLPGSNAIDGIAAGACTYTASAGNPLFGAGAAVAADSRGAPRPVDYDRDGSALCDIGAFERQAAETYTARVDDGDTVRFGATMVYVQDGAGGDSPGETTVVRYNQPPGGGSPDPGEMPFHVSVQPVVSTGLDITLTLCYADWELNGLDESSLSLYRYVAPDWIAVPADTLDTAANCATKHNVTELSAWTLGAPPEGPTAVNLLSVSARAVPNRLRVLGAVVGCVVLARMRRRRRHAL